MATLSPLRTLVICRDEALGREFSRAMERFSDEAVVAQEVSDRASAADLLGALRTHRPGAVFLGMEDLEYSQRVAQFLESAADGIEVVGLHWHPDTSVLRECMRMGLRECLAAPFPDADLRLTLTRLANQVAAEPPRFSGTTNVYSVLPSKPGVGATTVAVNTAGQLATVQGQRPLLVDLDLSCGMIRFLLRLPEGYSVTEAVGMANEVDGSSWTQLVHERHGLEVMHSGKLNPQATFDPGQVVNLIEFARRQYSTVIFDLSGNFERYSIQAMQESRRILMVCNPEPCSLVLAREKLDFLKRIGLDRKVVLVVNRASQRFSIPRAQIEDALNMPVLAAFADEYALVNEAEAQGSWVRPGSRLGGEFARFARALVAQGSKSAGKGRKGERADRSAPEQGASRRELAATGPIS